MIAINTALLLVAVLLCIPTALLCLEVLLALVPHRRKNFAPWPEQARLVVLIPAHNEQAVLKATMDTLLPTIPAGSRVLVVADNCTDATSTIARQCSAEVIERSDSQQRGKGFALDFGIRHLAQGPPDVVVFLDADCRVTPETVRLLAAAALATQRPVQGLNLCDPDPAGGALQLVSGFAFRFKNLVRTLGLVRLAGLNYLTGTGMALPWALIQQAKLASGNVVEDMQLGIDFALTSRPPLFLPEARVDSPLPQARAAARTQRKRWEHGHLRTLLTQSPKLLWLALCHCRPSLFWLALDLAIPPLSLFALVLTCTTLLAALALLIGASPLPAALLAAACAALFAATIAGWAAHCRHVIPLWALLAAPFYAALKLPIYAAFFLKRQQEWVRTERASSLSESRSPIPDSRSPT